MQQGIVLIALLLSGCTAPIAAPVTDMQPPPDVQVKFTLEDAAGTKVDAVSRDATLRFVFRVVNEGTVSANLSYTFPPHRVSVFAAGGKAPVWQAHEGRMFMQVMQQQQIAPGEHLEFAVDWDLRLASGESVASGEYEARPEFFAFVDDERLPAALAPVRFTVR